MISKHSIKNAIQIGKISEKNKEENENKEK